MAFFFLSLSFFLSLFEVNRDLMAFAALPLLMSRPVNNGRYLISNQRFLENSVVVLLFLLLVLVLFFFGKKNFVENINLLLETTIGRVWLHRLC